MAQSGAYSEASKPSKQRDMKFQLLYRAHIGRVHRWESHDLANFQLGSQKSRKFRKKSKKCRKIFIQKCILVQIAQSGAYSEASKRSKQRNVKFHVFYWASIGKTDQRDGHDLANLPKAGRRGREVESAARPNMPKRRSGEKRSGRTKRWMSPASGFLMGLPRRNPLAGDGARASGCTGNSVFFFLNKIFFF